PARRGGALPPRCDARERRSRAACNPRRRWGLRSFRLRPPAVGGYSPLTCATSSSGAGFGSRTAAVELPGDLLTPFGVFCLLDQEQEPGGDAFLFEGALGRYSYVGVGGSPRDGRRASGVAAPRITVRQGAQRALPELPENPLEAIRAALLEARCERVADLPPFCGG